MPHQTPQQQLVSAILTSFEQGFDLDEAAEHFIASTLGSPTVILLDEIINDEDHPERDALLLMLFTPSQWVQRQLEPLLEGTAFDRHDEEDIIEAVSARSPSTHFILHSNQDKWRLAPPEEAVDHFIGQLRITKHMPQDLRRCINTRMVQDSATAVKVMFRNSRFEVTDPRMAFFERFFETVNTADPDFKAALTFMIDFFEATAENRSILNELLERREFYTQAIRQARKHQSRMAEKNFETLILQGVKPVFCDIQQGQGFIILIDRICDAVYGHRAPQGNDAQYLSFEKNDVIKLGKMKKYGI